MRVSTRVDVRCDVNVANTSLECFISFIAFANAPSMNANDASKTSGRAHFVVWLVRSFLTCRRFFYDFSDK